MPRESAANASGKIRVLLAEDHHLVRAAIASLLSREGDIEIAGEVSNSSSLAEAAEACRPDVLVVDVHMPGERVIESARALLESHPRIHVLVLSAYNRREYVTGMLGAGALGYVLKDDPPETLAEAVRAVAQGRQWLSPRVTSLLVRTATDADSPPVEELTEREHDVLKLIAAGYRNERIAEDLGISEQTVKNHVRSIYGKLGVETRVAALLLAIERGWVSPSSSDPDAIG